jgi:hypothetical protein
MMRLVRLASVLSAVAAAVLFAPAAPASAAECSSFTTTTTGGYRVNLTCGSRYIAGVGTTQAEADQRARSLLATATTTGRVCTTQANSARAGGYLVMLSCDTVGSVIGVGTTLTDAALFAHVLATDGMATGRICGVQTSNPTTGGYIVMIGCGSIGYLNAVGTTLTDAANESRVLAINGMGLGRVCTTQANTAVAGGYRVMLNCGTDYPMADGPTLSEAARNARDAAF